MDTTKPEPMETKQDVKPKYRIKGNGASFMFPGFEHAITKEMIEGEQSHLFIGMMKAKDKKTKANNFSKFIEEVK